MTAGRHDENGHPASSGQLSVITILNRHPLVSSVAALAVRKRHEQEQDRRPEFPGRLQLISTMSAAFADDDTVRIQAVPA